MPLLIRGVWFSPKQSVLANRRLVRQVKQTKSINLSGWKWFKSSKCGIQTFVSIQFIIWCKKRDRLTLICALKWIDNKRLPKSSQSYHRILSLAVELPLFYFFNKNQICICINLCSAITRNVIIACLCIYFVAVFSTTTLLEI